ncbi:hypothetical protein Bca52824_010634 [Brassica carinata]|uniref:Uncharacterized protein n=1 Tax=Brassica carinata TaxID=52824 RepID=A0A8X7WDR3_BRACI|nr:hypothetical protein Bca52824_010634 [Brassica carinata]
MSQQKTLSFIEERVLQKLCEKDKELEMINPKNKELEVRIEQITMEDGACKQPAKCSEYMIAALIYIIK